MAEKILQCMKDRGRAADFVLCIGDDRSDEDMFEGISATINKDLLLGSSVFACTVGQKPSKAKYYLDDTNEVISTLRALADASHDEEEDFDEEEEDDFTDGDDQEI